MLLPARNDGTVRLACEPLPVAGDPLGTWALPHIWFCHARHVLHLDVTHRSDGYTPLGCFCPLTEGSSMRVRDNLKNVRRGRRRLSTLLAVLTLSVGSVMGSAPASVAYDSGDFHVYTHVQNVGWTSNSGTAGQGLRLEAIRVYQVNTRQFCGRAHVATLGWQAVQCTSTSNRQIILGTQGRSLAIEAVELWTPGYNLGATAHVQNIGWIQKATSYAGQHVTIGTTGQGLRMEAFVFAIK
ncbi:hypothetical protein [Paenarthrobacter sp. CCNWLW172]|uniref:hypothetical protein n=2 Tax=Paenarthrobacter TaxID=1742992 RepID=UPI003FD19606